MNEQEDLLLQHFVDLPQLKQVISDKDDLVKSIEKLASKTLQYLWLEDGCGSKQQAEIEQWVYFAEKNLLLEPSLETKRQTVLDKVSEEKMIFSGLGDGV